MTKLTFALLLCVLFITTAWVTAKVSVNAPHPHRVNAKHLDNLVQVHPLVLSGASPAGEAAFAELKEIGIKTIVSVDGAKPNLVLAKKQGLRYVHLPHGYDSIPSNRAVEIAKAVRDLEGPIYLHCHHGKHRSPAAASVACIATGLISKADAMSVLKIAGTSPNYQGLYQSVAGATRVDDSDLDKLKVNFQESVEVPPLAKAMVTIEQTHDHLKAIAAAGWQTPKDHPDLSPTHEALLLHEHFTELLRTEEVLRKPEVFHQLLKDSEHAAGILENALHAWQLTNKEAKPLTIFKNSLNRISANCVQCHQTFRD